jgi:AraC-like DNA-binding protein
VSRVVNGSTRVSDGARAAEQCGFAASHFSHRFGAIHGTSPCAYRAAGMASPSVLGHPGVRRLSHLLWD